MLTKSLITLLAALMLASTNQGVPLTAQVTQDDEAQDSQQAQTPKEQC